MRRTTLIIVVSAFVLLAGAGVAVASQHAAKDCPADASPERCAKHAQCTSSSEAEKRCAMHARKAAYCKEHPDAEKCQKTDRLAAYCKENPDAEKCQKADRFTAYCKENPDAEKCQKRDRPSDKRRD